LSHYKKQQDFEQENNDLKQTLENYLMEIQLLKGEASVKDHEIRNLKWKSGETPDDEILKKNEELVF